MVFGWFQLLPSNIFLSEASRTICFIPHQKKGGGTNITPQPVQTYIATSPTLCFLHGWQNRGLARLSQSEHFGYSRLAVALSGDA